MLAVEHPLVVGIDGGHVVADGVVLFVIGVIYLIVDLGEVLEKFLEIKGAQGWFVEVCREVFEV